MLAQVGTEAPLYIEHDRMVYRCARMLAAAALITCSACTGIEDAIRAEPLEVEGNAGATRDAAVANPRTPGRCSVDAVTPPAIVLSASAGDQTGGQQNFCTYDKEIDCGYCVDSAAVPAKHFTVVHSGDTITIGMPDGALTNPGPETCQPECPPHVLVFPHCAHDYETRLLTEDEAWTVDLAPGAYDIVVGASFEAGALSGRTSQSFGLLVDDNHERAIIEAGSPGTTCPADGSP